ncbi:MAG: response regulator [Chloroflexota bacterium]
MQTVLVVDDETNIRHMLRVMLEMSGYRVIEARDGVQALETAVEAKPDLIILDIMMPKLDGYSVCKQLRDNHSVRNIPILMMSGDNATRQNQLEFERCADQFLRKPFQFDQLLAHITHLLKTPAQI